LQSNHASQQCNWSTLVSRIYISHNSLHSSSNRARKRRWKSQHTRYNIHDMAPQKHLYRKYFTMKKTRNSSSRLIWAAVRFLVSHVFHWHRHHQVLQSNTSRE
ncbi:hypothetical protein BAE44_0024692, partial [Dichanthelium oligosanthes]